MVEWPPSWLGVPPVEFWLLDPTSQTHIDVILMARRLGGRQQYKRVWLPTRPYNIPPTLVSRCCRQIIDPNHGGYCGFPLLFFGVGNLMPSMCLGFYFLVKNRHFLMIFSCLLADSCSRFEVYPDFTSESCPIKKCCISTRNQKS